MAKKLDELLKKNSDPKAAKMAKLAEACAKLQAKFGKENVNYLGNKKAEKTPRIPSGSMAIDRVTGGGYPLGRIIEISGGPSAGKTTACYHAIAEAQKMYPDDFCGFIDSEYSADWSYAESLGVDTESVMISQPDDGHDAFGILQGMIEAGARLVVVDSVAAMLPKEEAEEDDYAHQGMALQARMMSKGLRKLTSIAGKHQCVVIFTNQLRDNVGVLWGEKSCVTLDTMVEVNMELMTMEKLFEKAGLNWKSMEQNVPYDVSGKNVKIKSFNHKTQQNEMRQILNLVYKGDAKIYHLVNKQGDILLKCSGTHRIWDNSTSQYFHVQDIESGTALTKNGENIDFFVKETNDIQPIVDMEVEGNENYFSNGILSHNTTTGGKALQYYSSIRLKFTRVGKVEEKDGDEKIATAIETKVESVKNKTYRPYLRDKFTVVFGKGIDNDAGIIETAISEGVIKKKGGWYSIDGSNVAQGLPALKEYLDTNPSVYERIKKETLEAIKPDEDELMDSGANDADTMTDDEIAEKVVNDNTEVGEV